MLILLLSECPDVRHCLVVERTFAEIPWVEGRDIKHSKVFARGIRGL